MLRGCVPVARVSKLVLCARSPNEQFVIYSSWSNFVHLCNVHGSYELHEGLGTEPPPQKSHAHLDGGATTDSRAADLSPGFQSCFFGIRFSPDNRRILAGANTGQSSPRTRCSVLTGRHLPLPAGYIALYDIEQKRKVLELPDAHGNDVNSVCFVGASAARGYHQHAHISSPCAADDNPSTFITGSDDCMCKVAAARLAGRPRARVQVWDTRMARNQEVGGFAGKHPFHLWRRSRHSRATCQGTSLA